MNRGRTIPSGTSRPERLAECDLDEVDADRVARKVRHLAAGNSRRHLDDAAVAVRRDDHLRERDAVPQPERVDRRHGRLLRMRERVAEDRRRVEVRPADAEADARRAQSVGERQQLDLAVPRDGEPVQLEPLVERLDDRLAGRRLRQRRVQVRLEIVERPDLEDAALAAGVRRLQHGGHSDRFERGAPLAERAQRRELRLWHTVLGKESSHRDLVRHRVSRLVADARQPECLGDGRDDRHRAIRGDGQHAVGAVAPSDLRDRVDIGEVDNLGDVRRGEPRRVRIAIDADDAQAELTRALDRTPLVPACTDHQHGSLHRGRS